MSFNLPPVVAPASGFLSGGQSKGEEEMKTAEIVPLELDVRLWRAPAHALMRGMSFRSRLMLSALLWLLMLAGGVSASTPVSSCTNITQPGYYYLTSDIINASGTCITIAAGDVVLDGRGHVIDGTYRYYDGIEVGDVRNVTIKNLTVQEFWTGIHFWNVTSSAIEGTTITRSRRDGVMLVSSTGNRISGNIIRENMRKGIALSSSSWNSVVSNTISGNWLGGVELYSSSGNTVEGNTFINNGLMVKASYGNTVANNTVNGMPLVYIENRRDVLVGDAGQVIALNSENITVRNLNLSNTDVGIYFWNVSYSVAEGNTMGGNIWEGVRLVYSSGNRISGNIISENMRRGVALYSSSGNTVVGNTISGNGLEAGSLSVSGGVVLDSSRRNTISGNTIRNNKFGVVLYSSSGNSVSDSIISGSYEDGVRLEHSSNNTISESNINGNVRGVVLNLSSGNTLSGNNISWNRAGVWVWHSSDNTISGNTITWNWAGVRLVSSGANTLFDNTISWNRAGVRLEHSSSNTISHNTISGNREGVGLWYASGNTLSGNTISGDRGDGAVLVSSSGNLIYNNLFNTTNNTIVVSGISYWNTSLQAGTNIAGGSYIGGNYWSSPSGNGYSDTCGDSDGDGICDAPYAIDANNTDYLPLTRTAGMPEFQGYAALSALLPWVSYLLRRRAVR